MTYFTFWDDDTINGTTWTRGSCDEKCGVCPNELFQSCVKWIELIYDETGLP